MTNNEKAINPFFQEQLDEETEAKNNLTFWFPILEKIKMRVPKTIIVHTGGVRVLDLVDGKIPEDYMQFHKRLLDAIKQIGLPCFLRSGMTSDKHSWKNSCYLTAESDLKAHLTTIIETSIMSNIAGYPFDTSFWVVRKLIDTEPLFYAFSGMPITKERRIFIKDGKVLCNHPYWPDEAFVNDKDKIPDYKKKMKELQSLPEDEERELNLMAKYIARFFKGFWSVDFLRCTDGRWFVIDMAVGNRSWHFPNCVNNKINECACELDGFQGAISTRNCLLHSKNNITS